MEKNKSQKTKRLSRREKSDRDRRSSMILLLF